MKKKVLSAVILIILAAAAVLVYSTKEKSNRVCFKNHCFNVDLAKTPAEISRGLMFRENLGQNQGMLFIFKEDGNYPFWMKNTLIPLDIVWVNGDKEVVFVGENTQPCPENSPCLSVDPGKNARYVLEINGGLAGKIGLEIGDKTNFFGFW